MYYKRMLLSISLGEVDQPQLKSKMHNLKRKYSEACDWSNKTGQGVDDGSVKEHIRKICDHYDILHEIFGHKVSFALPHLHDTEDDENFSSFNKQQQQTSEHYPEGNDERNLDHQCVFNLEDLPVLAEID